MEPIRTRHDLLAALRPAVGSTSRADDLVDRAIRLLGLRAGETVARPDLLLICEALTSEGGAVQRIAEEIATETLRGQSR